MELFGFSAYIRQSVGAEGWVAVQDLCTDGQLARDLPAVKEQATHLLTQSYSDQEHAFQAFAELDGFYAAEYPDTHEERQEDIQQGCLIIKSN